MAEATTIQHGGQRRPLIHFFIIPMMAPGHMNPMIDVARILARGGDGITVTILTTPVNANRFQSALDRDRQCGFMIQVHTVRFPCAEAGLPEGCENADLVPKGQNLDFAFLSAVAMMRPQMEEAIRCSSPPASCIVSDMLLTWTAETAEELGVPRIVFNGSCCFSYVASNKIMDSKILGRVGSETEMFVVPGLGREDIRVCRDQVKGCTVDPSVIENETMRKLGEKLLRTVVSAHGVIVNSFYELEAEYVEEYKKGFHHGRVWCIGPVSLATHQYDTVETGEAKKQKNNKELEREYCLKWLDLQAPGSTIYVSLGSLARLTAEQMAELALGLESSGRPFVWALGRADEQLDAFEEWASNHGFEERSEGRWVLVRGWAPQLGILSHPSVGGFLTHCGWNSTLEAVSAKVPMLTWPLFAEQFLNEKLVVDVLGVGVSLGAKVSARWDGKGSGGGVVVGKEEIKEAIGKLMDGDGNERRKVGELGEAAKKAIQKGGSSHLNLISFIKDISSFDEAPKLF